MIPSAQESFAPSARAVLRYLHQRLGFGLWMVTRTEQDDWIVLVSEDHGYDVRPGKVFSWSDSFCSHMVTGRGPRIAPDSNAVPVYAAAPIATQVRIGAYIGVPLHNADGSLFGTLCAIDPVAQPNEISEHLPMIELFSSLLSTILIAERHAIERSRHADLMGRIANSDALTGLLNRRGWDEILGLEEERCLHFGDPACLLVIDLDGLKAENDTRGHAAGDALIARAGRAVRSAVRQHDYVARVGGDEFAILGIGCNRAGAAALLDRVRESFDQHAIQASCGMAVRDPAQGLVKAWQAADIAMYEAKLRRKARQSVVSTAAG